LNYIDDFLNGVKLQINELTDEEFKKEQVDFVDNFVSDFKSKMKSDDLNEIKRFVNEFVIGFGQMLIKFKNDRKNNKTSFEFESIIGLTNKDESLVFEQTYGQKAVGINFNPSNDDAIYVCKKRYADLIDEMNDLRATTSSQEQKRLCAVAITELQTAQMWSVKALTWKD
jgi:hypothetical protein